MTYQRFSRKYFRGQMKLSAPKAKALITPIARWYGQNQRTLPWRETHDPYLIWLSEIILQQTRVEQGLPYFLRFRDVFPTVDALANAPEDEVMKLWQGLGYYTRARNLHAAAKQVMNEFGGVFPGTYDALLQLKGVGAYTAAAIASIAFGEQKAVVDGNVARVVARIFGIQEAVNTPAVQRLVQQLADELIIRQDPATHNQSMMEFGAVLCTPKNPACNICPVAAQCIALQLDLVAVIPAKKKSGKRTVRHFHFFIAKHKGTVLLEKRGTGDIWAGLYQFPMLETDNSNPPAQNHVEELLGTSAFRTEAIHRAAKHVLSHQDIHASFHTLTLAKPGTAKFNRVNPSELHTFALPRLIDRYLEAHTV